MVDFVAVAMSPPARLRMTASSVTSSTSTAVVA
jgi:hypothetical protein